MDRTVMLGMGGLLAINLIVFRVTRRAVLFRWSFIGIITLLLVYLAVAFVDNGNSILWLFAFPPVVFYISPQRTALMLSIGGLVATAVLFSPLGEFMFGSSRPTTFELNMLLVLAFEILSCAALDQGRRRSQTKLMGLAEEFEYAAKHDSLTGLANRREGHEQLDIEHERYLRSGRAFSVILLDIDLFKRINDNYGHAVGDRIIREVANQLRNQCRRIDTVTRWGGEEFLILSPETTLTDATLLAERIRVAIAGPTVTVRNRELKVTVSSGVATVSGQESPDRLLQRADDALYAAKNDGRNQVKCDPPAATA